MLWNKASRQQNAFTKPTFTGQEPSPGTTWPTVAKSIHSRFRQESVHNARRPCLTWHPRRCFGTKRAVIECFRETNVHRQRTIARYNLAYGSHVNS
nr:DUF1589 domain-containing protein [Rhodopirellula sp. UBA1907]